MLGDQLYDATLPALYTLLWVSVTRECILFINVHEMYKHKITLKQQGGNCDILIHPLRYATLYSLLMKKQS
jgi:hypothetical protein